MKIVELGQVWTPKRIAKRMAKMGLQQIKNNKGIKILDPAVGPATFTNALYETGLLSTGINSIVNYDVDGKWIKYTNEFTHNKKIVAENIQKDYLLSNHKDSGNFDLVIMNPPYVRHEKIKKHLKDTYLERFNKEFSMKIDGRSNLFSFFILKSIRDLKIGGILCAIVYDGIENTRYGKQVLETLRENTDIVKIEKTKMPFENVIVDALIIVAKKTKIKLRREKNISIHTNSVPNYAHLRDLMNVKRGTELINNKVFIADSEDPYYEHAKYFFKKQNKLNHLVIPNSWEEKAYIFESEEEVPNGFKSWIESKSRHLIEKKIIASYKTLEENLKRKSHAWYKHKTVTGDIVFNYYFREQPRYLLNPKKITVSNNYYAIDPIGIEKEVAWILLNTDLYKKMIVKSSRSQGNGLSKIQVYEYKNTLIPDWRLIDEETKNILHQIAVDFINSNDPRFLDKANLIVENYFSNNYVQ